MKSKRKFLGGGLCVLILFAISVPALYAAEVVIKGTVTEEGIVADDGQVYAVADNDVGKELMDLINKTVEVAGTVEEKDGKKIITIIDFEVIESD